MGQPVAKRGDDVVGMDTHIVLIPSPSGPVPTPMPMPFQGPLSEDLAATVRVDDAPAATVGSQAKASPPHIPMGGPFQKSPPSAGKVQVGSATVFADDKKIARAGDAVECCNDPADAPTGHVLASGTVFAGD